MICICATYPPPTLVYKQGRYTPVRFWDSPTSRRTKCFRPPD